MLYSSNTQTILFLNHQARKFVQLQETCTSSASGSLFHQASKPLPYAHTSNTMNSTLPSISFQSPCFKIQPAPQPSLWPPRKQSTRKPGLSLKLIRAALGPDANSGFNNADRRGTTLPSSPLSNVVQEFYSSLNEKKSKQLDKLMAPDCIVEDTAYYKPLDAKVISHLLQHFTVQLHWRWLARFRSLSSQKEKKTSDMQRTRIYFKRLMESMGEKVKFAIDEVCQGAGWTAAVMWHLGKITASLNYKAMGKSDRTIMSSYCLVQNGMDTSSPLPRAAASTYAQQMAQFFLSGS